MIKNHISSLSHIQSNALPTLQLYFPLTLLQPNRKQNYEEEWENNTDEIMFMILANHSLQFKLNSLHPCLLLFTMYFLIPW